MSINKVDHWTKQIDNMLAKDKRFVFNMFPGGRKALEGIKETIEESGEVTLGQIQAIKNIKWGKNPLKN